MPDLPDATIQVVGDATVDWMLVSAARNQDRSSAAWESTTPVRIVAAPGGTAFLSGLLAQMCAGQQGAPTRVSVHGITLSQQTMLDPQQSPLTRSFTVWDSFPAEAGSTQRACRIREFVGQQHGTPDNAPAEPQAEATSPTCLVIDDTNLGFRNDPMAWPACLRGELPPPSHIVLRITNPIAGGPLWETLIRRCPERLTVLLTVADLRKEYAAVGQPLSWERTSSEVLRAVRNRPELASVARVVVTLGLSGAVIIEPQGSSTMVFDPTHQEGDWERHRPGGSLGLGVAMTTALAYACACAPHQPAWAKAAARGLQAARLVHVRGFLQVDEPEGARSGFPGREAARVLRGDADDDTFHTVTIPEDEQWNMFATAFPDGYAAAARSILLDGEEAAGRDLPLERMGIWSSMDRTEIESIRSVRTIMREYVEQGSGKRPLSIAVFGTPGSGKSFAITQMAHAWGSATSPVAVLEFNLSQMGTSDELPRALQQVRDCTVTGRLPVVFWDEFDAVLGGRELGWLASFLAPMQDGVFFEGGTAHPIGAAIFVFAGGTHATMASFQARAAEIAGAKATDFLSRLRGYVDVLGPNPADSADQAFVLRRALMLRAMLRQRAPQIFTAGRPSIDPGIVRAFLHVDTYLHGARSMESLLDMSSLSGKLRYERSALPARHQLSLHVNADAFLALLEAETTP
jgi:hypothetical protein